MIPGLGRYPGEGNGNPLQCSRLGNPMDRRTYWATIHVVTKQLDMTWRLNHSRNDGILFNGGTSAGSCTACVWTWRRQKKATMPWLCYISVTFLFISIFVVVQSLSWVQLFVTP